MHDPKRVAHEINVPFYRNKWGHRKPIITIWHNDPEKDGSDDSCGWFIRGRHVDQVTLNKVIKEFESEWDGVFVGDNGYEYPCGWFKPNGDHNLSVQGIVFNMYYYAAKIAVSKDDNNPRRDWKNAHKFMEKFLVDIMYFAENNRDSMSDNITRKFQIGTNTPYDAKRRKEMIRECAVIIYTDVLRKLRPWYKHPKWHIHHWSFQFHLWQQFKRRYIDKCCKCGKRGFTGAAYSDWGGDRIWCEKCNEASYVNKPNPLNQ